MAMKITYEDDTIEILPEAVRVDTKNFHEGMCDFYDKNGNLLKQISLFVNISWEIIGMPENDSGPD
jgi:hypothetical protein